MRGVTMGGVVMAFAAVAAVTAPGRAQSEPISGTELAVELEREAARLQTTAQGWADAASLYVAAAFDAVAWSPLGASCRGRGER
jgi:hypothetical protein